MDDLLTTKELQDLLKIDRTTVYRMLNDGRLTGVKVGGQWRFPRKDVEALLSGRSSEPVEALVSTDILPVHCIQGIQDVFAEVAGLGAVTTTPEGETLTTISNACAFCQLILSSPSGRQACTESWRHLAHKPEHRTPFVSCHAGLQYARARIEIEGNFAAMLVAGQFHAQVPAPAEEAERIKALAEKHGLEAEALAEAARDLPVLSARHRDRIGAWLETVAQTFESIGHERADLTRRLQRIAEMSAIPAPRTF
jgi:excisionase family DNA binding protein